MRALGLECSKSGFSWIILQGTGIENAVRLDSARVEFPKNSVRSAGLIWAFREVEELARVNEVSRACLKRAEAGQSLSGAILERAEVDGVVQASLAALEVPVESYPWATVARLLGTSNKAQALELIGAHDCSTDLPQNRFAAVAAGMLAFTLP